MNPFISIITVSLNAEATIEDTLMSVSLQQRSFDIEHICVDGGSTDRTRDVIDAWAQRTGHIRRIYELDHGIFDAMNKGLRAAKGDYVLFLNADDFLVAPDTLAKAMDATRPGNEGNPDLIAGDVSMGVVGGRGLWRHRRAPRLLARMRGTGLFPIQQGLFAKRRVLEHAGGFNARLRLGSDVNLFYDLERRFNPTIQLLRTDVAFMRAGGAANAGLRAVWLGSREIYAHLLPTRGFARSMLMVLVKTLQSLSELRYGRCRHGRWFAGEQVIAGIEGAQKIEFATLPGMLETLPPSEVLACAICGNRHGNRFHLAREMMFGLRDEFHYLECGNCRCVQLSDIPRDMSKYYPENYYSFAPAGGLEAVIEDRWAAYAHGKSSLTGWLVDLLLGPHATMTAIRRARIPLDARVLDVGCGAGWLIRDMKRLGYRNVSGIDPNIKSDLRSSDGVVVLKWSLEEMTGEFDVVMFHHSLEHIADQAGALKEVRRLLRPVGRVLIRVPIADSFAWKHYGVNWIHLDAPRHFFLHSPASLRLLAEQCGLRVAELTYEGNAGQFIGSERYAKDISLVDQRKGGIWRRLQDLWLARRYRKRAEELNRNAQGDWGCFELRT